MKFRINIFVFPLLLLSLGVVGQNIPLFDFNEIKTSSNGSSVCNLKLTEHVLLKSNKGIKVSSVIEEQTLFLTLNSLQNTFKSLYYDKGNTSITQLESYTLKPKGEKKYTRIKTDKPSWIKTVARGNFVDDLEEIRLIYPSTEPGAIGVVTYNEILNDPHFIKPFYFGNDDYVNESEYSITFPKNIKVKTILWGDTTGILQTKIENKKTFTYTWSAKKIKGVKNESSTPGFRHYTPHLITYIESIEENNVVSPIYGNPNDLHKWYYKMADSVLTQQPDIYLKPLVDSLIKDLFTEKEKVEKIYYWVQDNIKYIAIEDGLGGYIPRSSKQICTKRFGDCKDKSYLLHHMLGHAGIKSYMTLIGTRSIPYTFNEVPTTFSINHMIISWKDLNNQWRFLDPTAFKLNLYLTASHIQDKEAFILLSRDSFEIAKVPAPAPAINYRIDTINAKIINGEIHGIGKSYFGGLWKNDIVNLLLDLSEKHQDNDMKKIFRFGNDKCLIKFISAVEKNENENPLTFSYGFELPDVARVIENTTYIAPSLIETPFNIDFDSKSRRADYEFKYKFNTHYTFILDLEGTAINSVLPENASCLYENFGFKSTYTIVGNTLIYNFDTYLNSLLVPKNLFTEFEKFLSCISTAQQKIISYKK